MRLLLSLPILFLNFINDAKDRTEQNVLFEQERTQQDNSLLFKLKVFFKD